MKKQAVMFISPVPRTSPQGRSAYTYVTSSGEIVNAGRNFGREVGKIYNFPTTEDGTRIASGLGRAVDNPWYDKDPANINEGLPSHWHVGADWRLQAQRLVANPEITKQLELEVRFNLPEGTLTDQKKLSPRLKDRQKDDQGNLIETFQLILYDRGNRFDDTTLRGALAIEMSKVSRKIANNKASVNPSRHDFYVSAEDEAMVEKNNKQDIINEAVTDLTLLRRNHTLFVRYQIATILGLVKGIVNENTVKSALNEYVSASGKNQLKNIEEFNKLNKLVTEGKEGMQKLWIKYLLKQAVNSHVMSLKSGHFIWHSKKGIDNLFDLGSNEQKVWKLFYDEFIKYAEEDVAENHYKDLLDELKYKGVKTEE